MLQLTHKPYCLLSFEQYLHLILLHLHLYIPSESKKFPLVQVSTQFPKSKFFESLQVKQLLLSVVGPI